MSDEDVATLDDLDVRTVVSFLTEREIEARGPDRLPAGTAEVALAMEGNLGDMAAIASEARRTGDFSEVPPELNSEIHRRLVDEGRDHYAALLREIGQNR